MRGRIRAIFDTLLLCWHTLASVAPNILFLLGIVGCFFQDYAQAAAMFAMATAIRAEHIYDRLNSRNVVFLKGNPVHIFTNCNVEPRPEDS